MEESDATFAHTFLQLTETGPQLERLGALEAARKKRPHRKSRRGCIACKTRRVKVGGLDGNQNHSQLTAETADPDSVMRASPAPTASSGTRNARAQQLAIL